jgi:DNA-binding MarR family transcriptional regulator
LGGVHGLSVNELMLLMQLDQVTGGRLRRVDLAERLDLNQLSITRMLAPMGKLGWVSRAEDARDGRVGYVVLTTAGRHLAREGSRTLARLLGRLTANLPGQLTS